MDAPLNKLPPELLRHILRWLRLLPKATRDNSFTCCLRTCSQWREIGESLLWTDVSLENDSIGRFTVGPMEHDTSILSLTLLMQPLAYEWQEDQYPEDPDIDPLDAACPETLALWDALGKLPDRIRRMTNLASFSLKVSGCNTPYEPEGFYLRTQDICAIVTALPPSLRHLEIDTYCLDRVGSPLVPPDGHLCLRINAILSRLSTLRLRVSRLCERLAACHEVMSATTVNGTQVSRPASTTDVSVVISTAGILSFPSTQPCDRPTFDTPWGSPEDKMQCSELNKKLLNEFARLAATATMSQSRKVDIIETFVGPARHSPVNNRFFPAVLKRSTCPPGLEKCPYERISDTPAEAFLRLRSSIGQGKEICGFLYDMVDQVEKDSWIETEGGARVSNIYYRKESRFEDVPFKRARLLSRDELFRSGLPTAKLWTMEEHSGLWLLHPVETNNLDDVGLVERDQSDTEIKISQVRVHEGPEIPSQVNIV
jgi:F-box-like